LRVEFVGTGEAFDENRTNTSLLINEFLVECGYNVPTRLWKENYDLEKIKYIFVSHFHADHVGGLPLLLMRMRQEKRAKPLILIGGKGFKEKFLKFFDLCYKGFFKDLPFTVKFLEVSPRSSLKLGNYTLSFEEGMHLKKPFRVENLAIRVEAKNKSLVYSGDTVFSRRIINLARGCDLLVHEAYLPHNLDYHKKYKAHSSPYHAAKVASEAKARILALVHINRNYAKFPQRIIEEVKRIFNGKILIPRDGEKIKL
jgi:ribonuclease BN (tRNA processing enzyme)